MPIPLAGADNNRRFVDPDHALAHAAVRGSRTAAF